MGLINLTQKIMIFYFSGTGNTWWIAKTIQEKLLEEGFKVEKHSIESPIFKEQGKIDQIIENVDYIGIGYPIYGSDMPDSFYEFITKLPTVEDKQAFIFTTMLSFSGDGALVARRRLKKKGFCVKQAINIPMPNNVKLPYPIFRSFPSHNQRQIEKIKIKATKKVDKFVKKFVKGKKWLEGRDPISILVALIQRVPMKIIGWSRFAKNFFVDRKDCIDCLQCVNYCPTNNIQFKNDQFSWGDNCIACLRCYNLCPTNAIQYKKATLNKKKYTRYKGPGNGFKVKKLKE
ncbi:MAG: hypothetical protein GF308_15900 [Candidatus Heimdallarchaeota archaeon]|nr:hypothetical protein [Candidatus Heimdallarchaeota archaeon]